MPKISDYSNLGAVQGSEEFIVSRGATSKKLSWSTIQAYLESKYLGYGGGVTNGNSHDHNGGDGAQINHTTLSNIGTNTHAQIDAFIAANQFKLLVSGNNWGTTGTTPTKSFFFYFTAEAGVTYVVRGKIYIYIQAVGDIANFKFQRDEIGTGQLKVVCYPPVSAVPSGTYIEDWNTDIAISAVAGIGWALVEFDGLVKNSYGAGEVSFYFWEDAGNTYEVYEMFPSYCEYFPVG